jgi:hypothetical protein
VLSWAKKNPNIFGSTAKLRMIITYDNDSPLGQALPVVGSEVLALLSGNEYDANHACFFL